MRSLSSSKNLWIKIFIFFCWLDKNCVDIEDLHVTLAFAYDYMINNACTCPYFSWLEVNTYWNMICSHNFLTYYAPNPLSNSAWHLAFHGEKICFGFFKQCRSFFAQTCTHRIKPFQICSFTFHFQIQHQLDIKISLTLYQNE